MKTRTKMEKVGLNKLAQEAKGKLTVSIEENNILCVQALKLNEFFGTKSVKSIIEQSIAHTASILIIKDEDLLEHSKIDKLNFIKSIKLSNKPNNQSSDKTTKNIIFKAMTWQLIIIASFSKDEINKVEELVHFCLNTSLKSKNTLFGEE